MGFLDFLSGHVRKGARNRAVRNDWSPPPRPQPVEEWQRRLDRYARKVAGLLQEDGVPTFEQTMWNHSFPLWVLSVDIEEGTKTWWTAKPDPFASFFYRGAGLLLTTSGQLIHNDDLAVIGRRGRSS